MSEIERAARKVVRYWEDDSLIDLAFDELREAVNADPAPIDWPARFRAAAEVAEKGEWDSVAVSLRCVAQEMHQWMDPDEVEAIGNALLGREGES